MKLSRTHAILAAALLTPAAHSQAPAPGASPPTAPMAAVPAQTAPAPAVTTVTKTTIKTVTPKTAKTPAKRVTKTFVRVARKPAVVAAVVPPTPPWKLFPLDPKVRVSLDFRNASIDAVLHMLSQASGVTIIKDPALTGGVTLQSPRPQSLGNAFAMLNAVLNLKNYEFTKEGDFLMVKTRSAAAPPAGPTASGPPGGMQPPTGPTMMVNGHPVSLPAGMSMPGMPGAPSPGGSPDTAVLKVYLIHYADATEVARVINDVFAPRTPAQQNPFQPQPPPAAESGPSVKASAEDFSNSLIVRAPSSIQDQIALIIAQIDKEQDQPEQPHVFKLLFANAADLQPVIENVLTGSSPLGRGGPTSANQSQNQNQQFIFFGQQPPPSDQGGTVVADTPTNSLIVTTTTQNLTNISQIIAELDKPAAYESTTFVYVLKNARADVVANLLNQSFGNRTTNGPMGGSLTNTGLTQSSGTNLANNSNNNGAGNAQPPSLQTNNGQSTNPQNPGVTQGGVFGSQNGLEGQNSEKTSVDSTGHVINVRSLMNQVLLVPNIDTNSIIVVAPPEDQEIVRDILKQLDEVPEQVMIETLVVEANLDKTDQLGVEYNFSQTNPGGIHGTENGTQSFGLQSTTTQPQGFRYTLTAAQYQIFVQAVQTDTRYNVLSTPRIFTTNNATAQINISQSLPYVTNSTVETTGTTLYNYNFLDVGIVLTVTPRITSNGHVTMDVTQTANDFVGYTSFNAPIVNQREAQTTVNVGDGQTVVLGGIINTTATDTISKVPFFGDLPIIGNLFRSTNKNHAKTELLVFLTPHIIKDPADAQRLREQTEAELGKTTQQMIPAAIRPVTHPAGK